VIRNEFPEENTSNAIQSLKIRMPSDACKEVNALRSMAPVSMEYPCTLLALLAAVFRSTAPPALCELSLELLPPPALIVGTLPNATARIVFPAQVPHHDTCPILHILGMVANREFFHQWEDIEIIRQEIFFLFLFLIYAFIHRRFVVCPIL
jgi:hypothetical protein